MNYSLSVFFSIFAKFFHVSESKEMQSEGYIKRSSSHSIGFFRSAIKDVVKQFEKHSNKYERNPIIVQLFIATV